MAVTAETRKAIIELVVTAYNAAPGTTLLTTLVESVDGGASLADVATTLTTSSTFKSLYPTFQTTAEFADELLSNLVPSVASDSDAYAEGKAAIEFVLNSGGTRADVILQAQTFLAALDTADPTFGEPAAAYQNKVTVATYHTVTLERDGDIDALQNAVSGVDSTADSVTTAQNNLASQSTGGTSTNLTDKLDTVSGTTSNDTVNGIVSNTTADVTYQVADSIDLGAGDGDVLNVSIISDNADRSYAGRSASGVEIINLKHVDGDATATTSTFNVSSITGLTQTWVKDGTVIGTNDDTVSVQGVSSSSVVGVANNDSDLDVTFTNTGSATTGDSITLAVGGGATGGVTLNDAAGDGFATVNIVTSGAAGSLSSLTSTDLTTVNISGDQKFTSLGLDSDVTTIDASANTAGVTVNANAGAKLKATGSAAADTLSLTVASSVSAGMAVSAFETVSMYASGSASVDMDQFTDVTTLALSSVSGAHGNTLTLTDVAASPVINAMGAGKSTSTLDWNGLTVNLKDSSGTSDSVTINIGNLGTSVGTSDGEIGALTAAGVETVTIAANDMDDLTINNATFAAAKTINYSGSADTNFGTLSTAALTSFAGGSATGDLTLGTLNNPTVDSSIATGSGKDAITTPNNVSAGKTMTITSGDGDDTITLQYSTTGGATTAGELGTVDLNTGDGNDKVTLTALVNGGIGDINFKLDGGAGTEDLFEVTAAGGAGAVNIDVFDNFERINLLGAQDNTVNLSVPTGYADTVLVTNVTTGGNETISLTAAAGGSASIANWTYLGPVPTLIINGSTGAETLTGSSQNETFRGNAGKDTISVGTGTDIVDIVADGDSGNFTAPTGTSVSTSGFDVISGLAAGDDVKLSVYTGTAAATSADNVLDNDGEVTSSDLSAVSLEANSIETVRGTYSSSANSFTEDAAGSDALLVFDSDPTNATTSAEAIVLVGAGALTLSVAAGAGGTLDIT
jgi:hypothetical protein